LPSIGTPAVWGEGIIGQQFNPASPTIVTFEGASGIELFDVSAGATLNGVSYAQFDGITSFSGGTGATGVGGVSPLPIDFMFLKGGNQENYNLLSWATASETDNSHFEIERSRDVHNFKKIAEIKAAGFSNSQKNYEYKDTEPLSNLNYYRLKQVDFDGKFRYSAMISIKNEGFVFKIYPNPVRDNLYIEASETGTFKITNTQGQILQIGKITGESPISLINLSPGIYYLQYNYQVVKFIKQ
jgi:hypothetical protein